MKTYLDGHVYPFMHFKMKEGTATGAHPWQQGTVLSADITLVEPVEPQGRAAMLAGQWFKELGSSGRLYFLPTPDHTVPYLTLLPLHPFTGQPIGDVALAYYDMEIVENLARHDKDDQLVSFIEDFLWERRHEHLG